MKFNVAVSALFASLGAEAHKLHDRLAKVNIVPSDGFQKVPNLPEKERRARAKFSQRLASMAKRRTNDNGQNAQYEYDGQYQDFWNNELVIADFGFDIDNYSLKYTGCHVSKGYSETIAENENFDTVLGADTYVTFRLCPTSSCDDSNGYKYGCSTNYGEYMVSLDEYVEALSEYKEEKKYTFCEYCETCAAMKGFTNWNTQMLAALDSVVQTAEASFEAYVENQMYLEQQNGYDNQDGNNGDQDEEYWQIQYYNYVHENHNNNAQYGQYGNFNSNNYQSGYSQGQMGNAVNGMQSQWWDYASSNQGNMASYLSTEKTTWSNMNSNVPSFCGQPVELGYFSDDGTWNADIGYWNQKLGIYVSFENAKVVPWDEDCWGDMPLGWANIMPDDYDDFDPAEDFVACNEAYSSQCGSGYDECMYLLHFDDLLQMEMGDDYDDALVATSQTSQTFASQIAQEKFAQYLTCQAVDYQGAQQYNMEESDYSNQANYQQLYQQKKSYTTALNNCGDDADCQEAITQAMYADASYQAWIIESAWELYDKYKAANSAFYVGAYCKEDGYNIGLKVFHDEDCLYPNDDITPEKVIGDYDIAEVNLDAVTSQCIPCRDEQYYLNMELDQDAQEADLQDENADGVLAFCSMLYQISAKCNQHLQPGQVYNQDGYYVEGVYYAAADYNQMYQSEEQADQEKKVCGMIESLNSGTYTEDGSIYLGSMGWSNNRLRNEISSATSAMSGGAKAMVIILALGVGFMGLWAMVLHGALQRKMSPWQPKDPVDLARQESGLIMGRTRSTPGTAPLV